jgi:cell division protein FtsB
MATRNYNPNNSYIPDSSARRLRPAPVIMIVKPEGDEKTKNMHRRNRDKAKRMDFTNVLFMTLMLFVSGLTLSIYIGLQSDITSTIKQIARLERELNSIRLVNDENYNRITNNVDLDYIRQVAITELGMTYAKEGQIIDFDSNKNDYVRQINPLNQ